MPSLRLDSVTAERLLAQLLAGAGARDPLSVVEHLLAVQGQDPRGARLAIRARSSGLRAADVDSALTDERSLVIGWLNRGTLHLVSSEDYPWLHTLTTPPLFTSSFRRLRQEGVSPDVADRAVKVIERSLSREGPLTRAALGERLSRARVPTAGQVLVHLLIHASLRGIAVRGPMVNGDHAYVLVRDWLGQAPAVDRDRALAELARRYLTGHGPADERDLAKWAGLPLRDIRSGLRAISSELVDRDDRLLQLARRRPASESAPPRLLGAFDPLLLGWRSRQPILGSNQSIITVNGLFRPFALVRGRAVATWRMPAGKVTIEPFGALSRRDAAALQVDARAVESFMNPDVR
jgi:hypothetical protein